MAPNNHIFTLLSLASEALGGWAPAPLSIPLFHWRETTVVSLLFLEQDKYALLFFFPVDFVFLEQ